jgi:hypothetical protein
MRCLVLAGLLAASLTGSACAVNSREARAIQPNPANATRSVDTIPGSVRLYIHQRDMHLPREYQLRSWAQFVVVTRERLRFHVGIVRYDEGEATTRGWDVFLEDETGRRYVPESREVPRLLRIAMTWRLWPYRPGDSWCIEPPCLARVIPGYEVYEGQADYVFKDPDLLAPDRKMLRLVLRKGGLEYRYTWRFGPETVVEHYGRTRVDAEMGTIVVPGPHTEVAGTRYESGKW